MSDSNDNTPQSPQPPAGGEGAVLRRGQPARVPRRTPAARRDAADVVDRPDEEGYGAVGAPGREELDPRAARRAERQVASLFTLSVLCTFGFIAGYVAKPLDHYSVHDVQVSNVWLGLTFGGALFFIGAAAIVWAKKLMPHEKSVQERHLMRSGEDERLAAAEIFNRGTDESSFVRRPLLRRSMIAAMAAFPLPLVVMLRDLGPLPRKRLFTTGWFKGARMVDAATGEPVKLGDIKIGGFVTVMPEGKKPEENALAPTLLIRLRPGENKPAPGREDWAAENHVAYNKICTHAGCPVGLYEQQLHQLFCPCHQSTFDVLDHCKVVFGPAARSLPQLAIYVDADGYFRARGDYTQPVGPSFWERSS